MKNFFKFASVNYVTLLKSYVTLTASLILTFVMVKEYPFYAENPYLNITIY